MLATNIEKLLKALYDQELEFVIIGGAAAIRRQHGSRIEGIRAAYETGAYSYQQIAKQYRVHFTTVGRVVTESGRRKGITGSTK